MNGSGILNHFIPLFSWISQFALYLLQTILLLRINSSTQLVVFCSWCVEVERWQAIPDAIKKLQNACILSAYHQVYKRSKKKKNENKIPMPLFVQLKFAYLLFSCRKFSTSVYLRLKQRMTLDRYTENKNHSIRAVCETALIWSEIWPIVFLNLLINAEPFLFGWNTVFFF